jgi:predicted phosphodiesterase
VLHFEIVRNGILAIPLDVKVLIVSDIHANWTALRAVLAVEQGCDNVLCLGDLVGYGPQPFECVGWAAAKLQEGGWFLQGNHDWSVAYNVEARCSKPYASLAEASRKFTRRVLNNKALSFLAHLPTQLELFLESKRWVACHGMPSDPLFGYLNHNNPQEVRLEVEKVGDPDYFFFGHTHVPCDIDSNLTHIINPGSVGQPRDENPAAAYAVWENGQTHFRRSGYDTDEIAYAFVSTGLHQRVVKALIAVITSGGFLPRAPS